MFKVNYSTQYRSPVQQKTKTFEDQATLGKEDFLRLLVTQMQHQDPTQPMQDREMIAQMTQFSMLEQMTNLNDMFTTFVGVQYVSGLSELVGKKVTWTEKVKEKNEAGEDVEKEVRKEGIVISVSVKDGKLVLQDGTKLDAGLVETITTPLSTGEQKPEEGEKGDNKGDGA